MAEEDSTSKHIVILGATGDTGKILVPQALSAGHTVTAVARTPSKITTEHPNLNVMKGDVFDMESLTPLFQGKDMVISTLGFDKTPGDQFSSSITAIVGAMKAAEVPKIVVISGWFIDPATREGSEMFKEWEQQVNIHNVLSDCGDMEKLLAAEEQITYCCVRAPTLTWDEASGLGFLAHEGQFVPDHPSAFAPRADLAAFLVSLIQSSDYDNKCVAVCTNYPKEDLADIKERLYAKYAEMHGTQG